MAGQNLLTIFVALTTVAVLIQTGILVAFYLVSSKLSRQAEQVVDVTRSVLGPLQGAVENLKTVTARVVEFSSSTRQRRGPVAGFFFFAGAPGAGRESAGPHRKEEQPP